MRKEETINQKAMRLKKKYGQEKAIQIIESDRKRFDKSRTYYKSDECKQAIQRMKTGII
jgi:hypothetical protein